MSVYLTSDLSVAENDLREHGYCLIESVLSREEINSVRERVLAIAAQERQDGTAYIYDNDSQRVFSLHNKGQEFIDLIEHPVVLKIMESALGYNFLLSSSHANIAEQHVDAGRVHRRERRHQAGSRQPSPRPAALVRLW
jgi:hypothetical protein